MSVKTIHCSICGQAISGYGFADRMEKLRRHYKKHHPTAFKKQIRKALETKRAKGLIAPSGNPNPLTDKIIITGNNLKIEQS